MSKRKNYTVTIVIEDLGNWPRIEPEDLWQHMTVTLPNGLVIIDTPTVEEEEDS